MTIARGVKYGALIALFIMAYTFMGVVTYRYHEGLFPGAGLVWNAADSDNWSAAVGAFWPIGLPMTLGIHAAGLVE